MRDEAEHKGGSEADGLGARRCRDAEGVRLRRAQPDDADFVAELLAHEDVEPFLRPKARESVAADIERSLAEPADAGVFVIELDGRRAGVMQFERANRRSRIAHLGGLAVHPDFRGRRLADRAAREFQRHLLLDLGFHRLQMEIYGFNERSIAHAERAGWVREGVKRKAYRRRGAPGSAGGKAAGAPAEDRAACGSPGGGVDGVMYGLVREDLGLPPAVDFVYEYVARHNEGVRTGDWEPLGECFADDAVLEFEGVPVGPFAGRESIVAAYRERPPDDEVRVLSVEDGEPVVARYAWAAAPAEAAGTLRAALSDGLIGRLTVTV